MYYVSRRDNETRIKVDEQYSNENTVVAEYLNGEKQGKTVSITHSTLKRWWKKIEEQEEVSEVKEESTPEKEIKEPKVKKSSKATMYETEVLKLKEYLKKLNSKFYASNNSYKIINSTGKPVAEVYPQKKKIVCYFKSLEGLDLTDTLFSKEGYKYYLPARVDISYTGNFVEILNNMLEIKEHNEK